MALTRPYLLNDTRTGIPVPNAYIRIAEARFNNKNQMELTLHYWASKIVYESTQSFVPWKVDSTSYVLDPFDQDYPGNIKTALYNWLKTQPEFISAVDA